MKNLIKGERAKKNWTQAILAEKIGVSRQAVNAIETGKFVPSTILVLRMAIFLKQMSNPFFNLKMVNIPNS